MKRYRVCVTKVQTHSHNVATIYFVLERGGVLHYEAGQYITVYFNGTSTPEGKAYSLSSAPSEKAMSITVKKVGEYSGLLHSVKLGDIFVVSEAYGFFNPHTKAPLVCIAAGVGIAPIWSIIKHEYEQTEHRVTTLLYSNKRHQDIPFWHEIEQLCHDKTNLTVRHHVTQDSAASAVRHRRINAKDCVQGAAEDACYLICGSVSFVRSMWQGLTTCGVAPEVISTETFFEQ